MQVRAVSGELKLFVLFGRNFFAEESRVPINLKCSRDSKLPRARWQFVFQINENGFGFATRSTDIHLHFFPRAIRQLCFQRRERKWRWMSVLRVAKPKPFS